MATNYRSLLAQKASLERKIAQARKREIASVVKQINALIAEYELTPQELRFGKSSRPAKETAAPAKKRARTTRAAAKAAPAPKYRDPETGQTWSGRGRAPKWIVGDKSEYLIS